MPHGFSPVLVQSETPLAVGNPAPLQQGLGSCGQVGVEASLARSMWGLGLMSPPAGDLGTGVVLAPCDLTGVASGVGPIFTPLQWAAVGAPIWPSDKPPLACTCVFAYQRPGQAYRAAPGAQANGFVAKDQGRVGLLCNTTRLLAKCLFARHSQVGRMGW